MNDSNERKVLQSSVADQIISYSFLLFGIIIGISSCTNDSSHNKQLPIEHQILELQKDVFVDTELDSSRIRLFKADSLLKTSEITIDTLRSENYHLIGLYYTKIGVLDTASIYFQQAINQLSDSLQSWRQADYFYLAWDTYRRRSLYGDCFSVIDRFESLIQYDKSLTWHAQAEYFKESTHIYLNELEKALEHNEERLKYARLTQDIEMEQSAFISRVQLKYQNEEKQEAFKILDQLIEESEQMSVDFRRQVFGTYGILMFYEGDFIKAIEYYQKSLQESKRLMNEELPVPDAKDLVATGYCNIAGAYAKVAEYNKSQKYLDSIKLMGFNNISESIQRGALLYQLDVAIKSQSNDSKVIDYLDDIYEEQNQQYKTKIEKELVALEQSYENEKLLTAEKQETQLHNIRLRTRFIIFSIFVGFAGLLGFFLYKRRQRQHEQNQLKMQQRLLRTQMNPHFTFNMLHSIKRLIKKDQELADNYLLKFSKLLRLTLENSMSSYILLDKELDAIKHYLDLQLHRMQNSFTYSVELDNIEADDPIYIPPMLMQPIIENCIEHGISKIDYPGSINIHLSRKKKWIECVIEDNGSGIRQQDQGHKHSASMDLISEFLKKSTQQGIQIMNKVHINNEETGVKVSLRIPYKLNKHD